MKRHLLTAVVLGFMLFAGIMLASDVSYLLDRDSTLIWGVKLALVWGFVGSVTFVIAWASFLGLLEIMREMSKRDSH